MAEILRLDSTYTALSSAGIKLSMLLLFIPVNKLCKPYFPLLKISLILSLGLKVPPGNVQLPPEFSAALDTASTV